MNIERFLHNHLVVRFSIIGAGFLTYWLTGGSPFATWIEWFRMISSMDMAPFLSILQLLATPLMLSVKSLFLLLTWGLLLVLAAHELTHVIHSLQRLPRIMPSVASLSNRSKPAIQKIVQPLQLTNMPIMPSLPDVYIRDTYKARVPPPVKQAVIPARTNEPAIGHSRPIKQYTLMPDYRTVEIPQQFQDERTPSYPDYRTVEIPQQFQDERTPSYKESDAEKTHEIRIRTSSHQAARTRASAKLSSKQNGPKVHAVSHTGLTRAHKPNEDSFLHITVLRQLPGRPSQWAGLFLVADGMGGHDHGKYASSTVVDTIRATIEPMLHAPQHGSEDLKDLFIAAIQRANAKLYIENQAMHRLCGTTLTGIIMLEETKLDAYASTTYTGQCDQHR